MNQTQKNYLLKRLKVIEEQKLDELKQVKEILPKVSIRFKKSKNEESLGKRVFELFAEHINSYDYSRFYSMALSQDDIKDIIDFEDVSQQKKVLYEKMEVFRKKKEKITLEIRNDFQKAADEVILGDSQQALKIINSLTNKTYMEGLK